MSTEHSSYSDAVSPAASVLPSSNDEVSLTITFTASTYEELKELAGGESGIGVALRDAIALSKWFNNTIKSGQKIFVRRNGKLHEVVKV